MRVFLLGATPSIDERGDVDNAEKLRMTGGNTGNQLIAHSLLDQLEIDEVSWDFRMPPAEVDERFDLFVIAASNFLFPRFDFGGMSDYIEATSLPCVVVGLGAQSNNYDPNVELSAGTERLIKVMAERGALIGVRGAYTKAVLEARGVHNTQVTGCPSYYVANNSELKVKRPEIGPHARVCINASRDVTRHSFDPEKMEFVVHGLIREAVARHADFVAQSEADEIVVASTASGAERQASLARLASAFAGVVNPDELLTWLETHLKVFFSVDEWASAIGHYDFVYGTRFHGCVVALREAVPSLVICHDTRTAEMCEFLGVPHLHLSDVDKVRTDELYARADYSAFERRYAELFSQYRAFLEVNGLPHRLAPSLSERVTQTGASS